MSAKGRFLILRRFRAGDWDLMIKAYSSYGLVKLFVQEGLIPKRGLLGYMEPFNLLHAVYHQSGDVLFLKDIISVDFFSYLCFRDYSAYLWMNSLVKFVEKWFVQYDPELFNMLINYLRLNPKNRAVLLIKFKLEFLKRLGIYKDDIFEQRLARIAKIIMEEGELIKLERLKINIKDLLELDMAIDSHLSTSL
ncbi:MAG: hypothetical protein ACK4FY_03695 [Aquificaceae bacterium]